MDNFFVCPHCRGHLKVGDQIVFRVRNQKRKFGLLLLSAQIGNYDSLKHPDFEYKTGEALEFYCPLCSHILSTSIDENLIFLLMVDNHGLEHNIYFSRISGERSTFQVSGDKVMATGEHSGKYTYFNISDRFRPYLKK
jgi:hypothetical protein